MMRQTDNQTGRQTGCQSCRLTDGTSSALPAPVGDEALCAQDEAFVSTTDMLRVRVRASPVKQMPTPVTVPTYMDRRPP